MARESCKLKICICADIAEDKALQTNFDSYLATLEDLSPTELDLLESGIENVLLKADKAVKANRNLNESLVDFLVNLAQNAP